MNEHGSFAPAASLEALTQRSQLLRKVRDFFFERGFIEVETPLLAGEIIPELHIDPIVTSGGAFLQASPELFMKRLLAAGAPAIFQVARSFRAEERGELHNPEFTMIEWYRVGDCLTAGIDLLDELMQAVLETPAALRTSYGQAFERTLGVCPHRATVHELATAAKATSVPVPDFLLGSDERDEWLNLLLATRVEPELGRDRPEIIYHYPASQASLARVVTSDHQQLVAERFELYYRGVELANGFHELADAEEQRRRFVEVNATRVAEGRQALPIPKSLLAALKHGLPDCTGVALGFDRLAALAFNAKSIHEVMAFPDDRE